MSITISDVLHTIQCYGLVVLGSTCMNNNNLRLEGILLFCHEFFVRSTRYKIHSISYIISYMLSCKLQTFQLGVLS